MKITGFQKTWNRKMNRPNNQKYKNIIFIGDEETLVRVYKKLLTPLPVNAYSFSRTHEAMNFLWEHQDSVSLITTDLHHLGMCVSDMVWTVKGLFPDLPVVIITGHGPSGYHLVNEGLVDEYMDKPFEPDEYVNMIKRFLKLNH